jgi:superfamily II RNA helicase
MERLEEVTWPKPLAELLEAMLATYRHTHPWISQDALSPKSVVREMYERGMTFNEFISAYGLSRSEGLVLRYLTDAYRTLRRTVPEAHHTEELEDVIEWLGELVRQTDSSLLDEWEDLVNPDAAGLPAGEVAPPTRPLTANERAFTVMIRNAMFHRVELASRDAWEQLGELEARVAELTDPPQKVVMTVDEWNDALGAYYDDHDSIATDQGARSPALLQIEKTPTQWLLRQVVVDPDDDRDWGITAHVDLAASDDVGAAVLTVTGFGRLGG